MKGGIQLARRRGGVPPLSRLPSPERHAGAQSTPALRSRPPPTAQTPISSLVFPSAAARANVADGFVYAVLGDISAGQAGSAGARTALEFDEVLKVGARRRLRARKSGGGPAFAHRHPTLRGERDGRDVPGRTPRLHGTSGIGGCTWSPSPTIGGHGLRGRCAVRGSATPQGGRPLVRRCRSNPSRRARGDAVHHAEQGRVTVVATAGTFRPNFVAADESRGARRASGDQHRPARRNFKQVIRARR